jgi:hypothetical protein
VQLGIHRDNMNENYLRELGKIFDALLFDDKLPRIVLKRMRSYVKQDNVWNILDM